MAVMSGVDFRTIAAWVGHKDGGVLIGKVYGHLADGHRKAMGERVHFKPLATGQTPSPSAGEPPAPVHEQATLQGNQRR